MPVPARNMTAEPVPSPDESEGPLVAPVTTEVESVKVSRAGRNLPAAIAVGLTLGAAVVVTLFVIPKWTFVVLATAAVCVGVWELCRALRAGGFAVPVVPSIVGCISMLGAAYVGGAQALLVCYALTCVACVVLTLHGPWWTGLVAGAAAAVGATTGDLVESTIKRDLGIKDMSNILPGHGGLMDRLDSLVLTAPIIWAVLAVLVPVTTS